MDGDVSSPELTSVRADTSTFFETAPEAYFVVSLDAPAFHVVGVNAAYLAVADLRTGARVRGDRSS